MDGKTGMRGFLKGFAAILVLGIVGGAVYASALSSAHRETEYSLDGLRDWLQQTPGVQVNRLHYDRDTFGGAVHYDIELQPEPDSVLFAPLALLTGEDTEPRQRLRGTMDLRFGPWIPDHGLAAMTGEEVLVWADDYADVVSEGISAGDPFARIRLERALNNASELRIQLEDADIRLRDSGSRLRWDAVHLDVDLSAARRTLDYQAGIGRFELDAPEVAMQLGDIRIQGRAERVDTEWFSRSGRWQAGLIELSDATNSTSVRLEDSSSSVSIEHEDGLNRFDFELRLESIGYQQETLGGLHLDLSARNIDGVAGRRLAGLQQLAEATDGLSTEQEAEAQQSLRAFYAAGPRLEQGRLRIIGDEQPFLDLRMEGGTDGEPIRQLPADADPETLTETALQAGDLSVQGELLPEAYRHLARWMVLFNDPQGEAARDSNQLAAEAGVYQVFIEMAMVQMPFFSRGDDGEMLLDLRLRDGWIVTGDERVIRLDDILD